MLENQLFGDSVTDSNFNCLSERDFGSDNLVQNFSATTNIMNFIGDGTCPTESSKRKKKILRFKENKSKMRKNKENNIFTRLDSEYQANLKPS